MGTNEYSQLASKSWDSQNFGDVNMVLKWPIFTSPPSHNELIGCEFYAAKADGVVHCWQFHVLAILSLLCPPYNRYQLCEHQLLPSYGRQLIILHIRIYPVQHVWNGPSLIPNGSGGLELPTFRCGTKALSCYSSAVVSSRFTNAFSR